MEEAARAAAAHDVVLHLPYGYATLLDRDFKDGTSPAASGSASSSRATTTN